MTELKTLEDIKPRLKGTSMVEFDLMKEAIREEAIKWVKELGIDAERIKKVPEAYNQWAENGYPGLKHFETVKWIKHFFGITSQEIEEYDN